MLDEQTLYWLGITRVAGLGVRGAHQLLERFGSPAAAYHASLTELESCVSAQVAQAIFSQAGLKEADSEIKVAEGLGSVVLTLASEDYPPLLKEIPDSPLVLYVRGDAKLLSRYGVAVVGTRRPTAYGLQVARRLARDLAERGLVIISGLARGVDSAGHHGALEARQGKTVAVLGSGVDEIYPRENRRLADKIMATGAVVSEFPFGTSPKPENFPIRNRIISGLSLGVIIVEAAEYSGSLITARLAAEQNREVFAVPGNITTAQSFGPNHLIKQGAKLVDQWADVVEEFPAEIRAQILPLAETLEAAAAGPQPPGLFEGSLTPDQKTVFEVLRVDEALFVDSIVGAVLISPPRVLAALLELEMSGLIRQTPGKNFIRKL